MTWSSLRHVPVFISLQPIKRSCCACFTFVLFLSQALLFGLNGIRKTACECTEQHLCMFVLTRRVQ